MGEPVFESNNEHTKVGVMVNCLHLTVYYILIFMLSVYCAVSGLGCYFSFIHFWLMEGIII